MVYIDEFLRIEKIISVVFEKQPYKTHSSHLDIKKIFVLQ